MVLVALVVVPVVTVSAAMVDDAEVRRLANDAVPVNVGDPAKTRAPVPVSSVMRAASLAEVSSEVLDILLLNTVKSAAASLPVFADDAIGRLKVSVDPDPVIVKSVPVDDVARVTAGPVVVCPAGPIEVSADVSPWVRHAPLYE